MPGKSCSCFACCGRGGERVSSKLRANLSGLTICSLILLFISGRIWVTANFAEANVPTLVLPITGRALHPLGAGCAWALIASVLAYSVSKGVLRKLVASVMVLLSAAVLVSSWSTHGRAIANQVDSLTSEAIGRTLQNVAFATNSLWLVAVICSVFCLVSAILLLVAPSGPGKPTRYERPENVAELSPWQALDAGIDPTQD